tara:strand:+ start:712 stop:1539 length:828 start_codon:yes stop_codon:yes gene_type:complete
MENIQAVYNGKFDFLENIKISPLSRAYTFSDSVYEVIPFFKSNIIAYDKHIERLKKSCAALSFVIDANYIENEILELINKIGFENGYVYYQISRGVDPIRSHMFDNKLSIETFGYVVEHSFSPQKIKVMICEDLRWQRCDIKSTSLLGNVMSMNQAKDKGCGEVIMHKDNIITEGGASNVFFTDNDCVYTPSLSSNILPGITRDLLINKLKEAGIKVEEGKYSLNSLLKSKSIWLTSSTKGLALVTDIIDYNLQLDHENIIFKKCETIFRDNFLS